VTETISDSGTTMIDPNRDRLQARAHDGAREEPPEEEARAASLVEDLLHTAGRPLPESLIQKALGHFLRMDPVVARQVVDALDGSPGPVVRTKAGDLDLLLRQLDGAALRLRPTRNEIAFGYLSLDEADRGVVVPLAFTDPHACDALILLEPCGLGETIEERLVPGGPGRSWLTGLGRWFTARGVGEGDAIVLRRHGITDPLFRLAVEREGEETGRVDREKKLLDRAEEVIARFGPGPHLLVFVMRRLLLTGLFHEDPPPGPLLTLLESDPRFEVEAEKGLVALVHPPPMNVEDPLAQEEHRYLARDQSPSVARGEPSVLLCGHCEKSFADPSPFLLRVEGLELLAGACPNCRRVGIRASGE